jgi:hypothetical protein
MRNPVKIVLIVFCAFSLNGAAKPPPKEQKNPPVATSAFKYVDDFDDGRPPNLVGGDILTEAKPPAEISFSYDSSNTLDDQGYALKIDYRILPEAPASLIIGLNDMDISQALGLSFWLRSSGNIKISVSLKDNSLNTATLGLERYLSETDSWQKISLASADFPGPDFNSLKELSFILSAPETTTEGTLSVDEIVFFGPANVFFESLKDNLYAFPTLKRVNKKYLLREPDAILLKTLARDSWLYFKNLVDKKTHLPLDWIDLDETKENRIGDYTSPTNIGLYFLSIIGAFDLGFITKDEALSRLQDTLKVIKGLPRWNGLWYNWYSTTNLQITRQYISSVDNGWLAAGLIVLGQAFPEEAAKECAQLLEEMDFSHLYDPVEGKLYLGYELNREPPSPTPYHYGLLATEPRVASLIAIGKGDLPEDHWFRIFRTPPRGWTWQSQIPKGKYREYLGIDVFEGYYAYKDLRIVPSWGGSLFEFLMPTLVVKEKELAAQSLGLNNTHAIKAHIDYALNEKRYPVWGISPCSTPDGKYGGYTEFGVARLGAKGYKDEGVITPHASILAIDYFPQEVSKNIRNMLRHYDFYGEYGPYDSFNVLTKQVSTRYLCLDQGMLFVALANYLTKGKIRERFHNDPIIKKVEHLLEMEEFF